MSRGKTRKTDALAKANGSSKLKKDPGVPKLPQIKIRHRPAPHAGGQNHGPDATMASEPTLASLAHEVRRHDQEHGPHDETDVAAVRRRQFIRQLHRVIDQADVVLLVLDARDPPGSRSRLVEDEVRRKDKKLVFILNKIDLVPRHNAEAWLAYLRHEAPTLPFRASTQSQRTNLSTRTAPAVLHLLKSFRKGPAGSITAGVVGAPNVGKSSLINSLKRARVCATAAEPGCTTDLQTIALERGVKIVDSPGVVFDDHDAVSGHTAAENAVLRNVLSVDDIADPIAVVGTILARTDAGTIQKLYKLPPFTTSLEFLTMLALTTGRLGPGGTPDTDGAARVVLRDWNRSKIPFFTDVPQRHTSDVAEGAQIVGAFAPAFDLGALYGVNDAAAFGEMEIEESEAMQDDVDDVALPNSDPDADAMRNDDQDPISAFSALPSSASRKRKRSVSPDADADADALPFANASFHSEDSPMSGHHPAPPSTAADSERPVKRQRLEKIKKPRNQAPPPTTGLALASPAAVRAAEAQQNGENALGRKALRLARKRAARAARKGADSGGMAVDDDEGGGGGENNLSTSTPGAFGFAFSVSVPFGGLGEVTI